MGEEKVVTTTIGCIRNIPVAVFDAFLLIKSDRAKLEGREVSKNELYVEALTEYARAQSSDNLRKAL